MNTFYRFAKMGIQIGLRSLTALDQSLSTFFPMEAFPFSQVNSSQLSAFSSAIDLQKFSARTHSVDGMTWEEETELLFYLAALSTTKGDIIEVGSWLGKSTIYLALGCQVSGQGVVHAVDTFGGNPGKEEMYTAPLKNGETIYQRFQKNIQLAGIADYVKAYPMTSRQARKKIKTLARLVFIDACHDYEAVKDDIQLWADSVSSHGYLVFHDYSSEFPQTVAAIKEELQSRRKQFHTLFLSDRILVTQRKG